MCTDSYVSFHTLSTQHAAHKHSYVCKLCWRKERRGEERGGEERGEERRGGEERGEEGRGGEGRGEEGRRGEGRGEEGERVTKLILMKKIAVSSLYYGTICTITLH